MHERGAEAEINEAAGALRESVANDDTLCAQLNAALDAIGVELCTTYGDGIEQRVQMTDSGKRRVGPLGAHRDSWGSNIMAQTNWWAPVFPTTPERTLALFPTWFERPVPNDSEGWDFRELLRRLKAEGPDPSYPLLPLATEPPPWAEALPVSLVPGDLMCFSGAHLHATVPNRTNRTRLSFETRTVNADDVAAGHGAPNVGGAPVRTAYHLFRRITDGQRLGKLT